MKYPAGRGIRGLSPSRLRRIRASTPSCSPPGRLTPGASHDRAVDAALDDAGVASAAYRDALLHEPGSVTTNEGEALPTAADLGFGAAEGDVQPAGTLAVRGRLGAFFEGPVFRYESDRDYPTRGATSRLSADLKWGTVGIREVYRATAEATERADGED